MTNRTIPSEAIQAAAQAAGAVFDEPANARDIEYIRTILEAAEPYMRQAFILEINLRAVQDELSTPLQSGETGKRP